MWSQKHDFVQNLHANQMEIVLKRHIFSCLFPWIHNSEVAQHVIFHWATSQHDTSFKGRKRPFYTTNGQQKTTPPPKKQHIYPIRDDGAV